MNDTTTVENKIRLYWGVWSVFLILGVLIIVGNSLVCVMFVIWKNLRNPTNTFLVMLAIADLLIGLIFIPLYIGGHYLEFYHSVSISDNIDSVLKFVFFASVFNLYAVTVDRYIAVLHALRYKALMKPSTVRIIAAAVWLLPAVLTGILWICMFTSEDIVPIVLFGMEVVFVIIPGFVMTVIYVKIFKEAKKQIKQVASLEVYDVTHEKEKARKRKSEQKAAQTCALLVILFFICWLPTCFEQILGLANVRISPVYTDISMVLMIANSAVNPFLYGFTKQDFRNRLKIIFRWPNRRNSVDTTMRAGQSGVSQHEMIRKTGD